MINPYAQVGYRIRCDWGPIGGDAVGPGAQIVAVVDVLSFTTALTVAADRGVEVFPYRWRDDRAVAFAERHGAMLAVGRSQVGPDAPVSLSPATIRSCAGLTRLVLPSPNGSTIARRLAEQGATVIGVSLRNARAAARWAARQLGPDAAIAVVPAGERWNADGSLRPAVEDLWGAGAFVTGLSDEGVGGLSPEAEVAAASYRQVAARVGEALRDCASGRELIQYGYPEDVDIAAEVASSTRVPVLDGERFRPVDVP
ncbi:2-phosphosulfolactate phosphatase [Micromonospora sp. NPDC049559]|uniref:2-phosphosulfolactate phosphatase n=1 Tax=Micromonospora sp. NPDC049559 TaxID=3155923 RepID=UPI0034334B83